MLGYWIALVAMSLGGLRLTWWLWTHGVPEKYVTPLIPEVLDGPITLDTDLRGLV